MWEKSRRNAIQILAELKTKGIRCEVDNRDEKIGYKIREAQLEKVPYMLVLGEKESDDGTVVAVRSRDKGDLGSVKTDEFITNVLNEISSKG